MTHQTVPTPVIYNPKDNDNMNNTTAENQLSNTPHAPFGYQQQSSGPEDTQSEQEYPPWTPVRGRGQMRRTRRRSRGARNIGPDYPRGRGWETS
jgi:hypothetical protein